MFSPRVTRREFEDVRSACSNWGRWGADDQRGTLNYISAACVRAAATLVTTGRTISLAWPLDTRSGPDNPKPAVHHMTRLFDVDLGDSGDLRFASDYLGLEFHGDAHSHIDALCHVSFEGHLYNGVQAQAVTSSAGATSHTIDLAKDGIVGRGVLLDIPRLRGVPWLEPGEAIMEDELLAAETAQSSRLREGDILLVRTGHAAKRRCDGPWASADAKAGLHTTALPLLHARRIAAAGFDGDGEAVPGNCEGVRYPIHAIGIPAMGLTLLDSLYLEDLADACAEAGRWEFLCVIAPLRVARGTGSPVNPIAIL